MTVCTFFGHREFPDAMKPVLQKVLEELILKHGVELFYVGNQGQFDACVRSMLRALTKKYPHIRHAVVLAYLPAAAKEYEDHTDTMLPEGIEWVHSRYAISWRNSWMLRQSDVVVTYITHTWGAAYRFAQQAAKQGKRIINIPGCTAAGR